MYSRMREVLSTSFIHRTSEVTCCHLYVDEWLRARGKSDYKYPNLLVFSSLGFASKDMKSEYH